MGLPFSDSELAAFQTYLTEFASAHPDPISPEGPLPVRLVCYYLTKPEMEAECLDWTLAYLEKTNCPEAFRLYIGRQVVSEMLELDSDAFLQEESFGGDERQMEASRVAVAVFSKVHEVCRRWSVEMPTVPRLRKSTFIHDVYTHAIKNTRRKMEDRHVMFPYLNPLLNANDGPSCSYYGVYDGHGGVDAAVYTAAHLHLNVLRHEAFLSNPEVALREAFLQTDKMFVEKAERESLRSGTTGVTVVIQGKRLYTTWLGDSQAVLCREGKPVTLMSPHKPEKEEERKRIEEMGGCVVYFGAWRVNGTLSVSRAIGDAEHKPYVWGQPDTSTFSLDGSEEFIILACDGLWDVTSEEGAIEVVKSHVESTGSRDGVANTLVRQAKENGSGDNITVVVVFLDGELTAGETDVLEETACSRQKKEENKEKAADSPSLGARKVKKYVSAPALGLKQSRQVKKPLQKIGESRKN
eukprot:m.24524 g.24524  ORF g.24524 m.24524 type:complete len:467 (+) comp28633_c0_seq1:36-1436(+)